MISKYAWAILEVKFSDVDLLGSSVVIYLSWSWSLVILFSISIIFVLFSVFVTKLLPICILFSTAVRAAAVPKLVILGILFLTPFNLALKAAVVANLVISIFHIYVINV